jgi:hypothetical protein
MLSLLTQAALGAAGLVEFTARLVKLASSTGREKRRYEGCRSQKGCFYKYKEGEYVREVLNTNDKDCKEYRYVKVPHKPGRLVLVCVTDKKGPRGGKTKALALLRRDDIVKRKKDLPRKAKELASENDKKEGK